MRIDPSMSSPVGNVSSNQRLGIQHDNMTEENWVSAWPALPPISMEEFAVAHDKALEELGISQNELVENGAITPDLFQAHIDIISNFKYLYSDDDDDGLYGDDEDDVDGDDGDGNMYDCGYSSRCMGGHARYRRRQDELRTRARKISAGIENVASENGSIAPGFMYVRNEKYKKALDKAENALEDAKIALTTIFPNDWPKKHRAAERAFSQAKRNMFKLKRAFIKSNRASKNMIKLARHYSIYCAGYNRYLKDDWAKDYATTQDNIFPTQVVDSTEEANYDKLHDTSDNVTFQYDQPSKNQSFVSHNGFKQRANYSYKKKAHSVTAVYPTIQETILPTVFPLYFRTDRFAYGCF